MLIELFCAEIFNSLISFTAPKNPQGRSRYYLHPMDGKPEATEGWRWSCGPIYSKELVGIKAGSRSTVRTTILSPAGPLLLSVSFSKASAETIHLSFWV